MIGVTPAFLRSLGAAGLIEPERSPAATAVTRGISSNSPAGSGTARQGFLLAAACRIVTLEDRLAAAHRRILELGGTLGPDDDAAIPMHPPPTRHDAAANSAADPADGAAANACREAVSRTLPAMRP